MALSSNQVIKTKNNPSRAKGPVASGAIHIYKGALLNWSATGYLELAADTASEVFAGVALEELNQATGGSDGDNEVNFIPAGSGEWVKMTTGTISRANVGDKVYANGDDQVDLAATTTNDVEVGVIREYISTTSAYVQI